MKLIIKNLEFRYRSDSVLEDICLELAESEILGIVGVNGSGKSTLIKCIARLLNPNAGAILVDGTDIKDLSIAAMAQKAGYVPQSSRHSFSVTVFDAVLMGRRPHLNWRCKEEDYDKILEILHMLNIEDLALRDINELSGGEQQKVCIARALAQEPEILLLDEPTSNLDIRHQLEVLDTLRAISSEKKVSMIMAIHDLNLAVRYTDRMALMKDRKIFAAGNFSSVLTKETIRHVFGVETEIYRNNGTTHIISLHPA